MKTVGIIAEYNPFHKGHAYHLARARELTGADFCIVVMSGSFVQRGLPALADKYARAEMALRGGADLVLELPSVYASGSAEYFAGGAIALLDSLGCIDYLCFGSECGDLAPLLSYARLFEEDPEGYQSLLKAALKQGLTYPAARSLAAKEYLNCTEQLPAGPNNTLGIEYCRALLRSRSSIRPVTLRRTSAGYHDLSLEAELASASAIREAIFQEGLSEKVKAQLPAYSFQILENEFSDAGPVFFDSFSEALFYRLLSLSAKDLAAIWDVSEDLADRMENLRFQFTTASDFADLLKTKQLTHTRITRALCHILLDLKKEDLESLKAAGYPVYPGVLGLRRDAAPLLSALKQSSASPLLVKAADAPALLNPTQQFLFEKDVFAAHLCERAFSRRYGTAFRHAYTRSPILLP